MTVPGRRHGKASEHKSPGLRSSSRDVFFRRARLRKLAFASGHDKKIPGNFRCRAFVSLLCSGDSYRIKNLGFQEGQKLLPNVLKGCFKRSCFVNAKVIKSIKM